MLRLALDAQAAGAIGIIDETGDPRVSSALADRRLQVPRLAAVPPDARVVSIAAHYVLHRSTFAAVRARLTPVASRFDFDPLQAECSAPFGFAPIAVTDAHAARLAERRLFRSLRKVQDGWTSRWLNRHISLFVSRWLVRTPLSPNHISIGILAIGLFGAYLASRGTYFDIALGAVFFQAQSVLDGCDGEISRITYRGSKAGEWFDTIGDDLTNYSFFACAGLGLYRTQQQPLYLAAAALTVLCGVLSSGLEYRYLIRIGSGDLLKYPLSQATTGPSKGIARLAPLLKRDTFVFLTMLAAFANQVGIMLLIFAVGAVGITAAVIRTEVGLARSREVR